MQHSIEVNYDDEDGMWRKGVLTTSLPAGVDAKLPSGRVLTTRRPCNRLAGDCV